MYRIRLHGRGGQGMKTASRILGSALFARGFEVQDAPRYGAERRGAPIFAYVRAAREPIHERGVITHPDLVVVADETLVPVPAAGVLLGVAEQTLLVLRSAEPADLWRERLKLPGPVVVLPGGAGERAELRFVGAECAAGAARLLGCVPLETLEAAIREELADMGDAVVAANLERARATWAAIPDDAPRVVEGPDLAPLPAEGLDWIEVPFEGARISAPDIHGAATSVQVRTGLWRTVRPVIDHDRCRGCHWVCSTLCPDGAIVVDEEDRPQIDYDHCKGCMICVAVCPPHAIAAVPESEAAAESAS
jgi:pyruvate ferredoxin oxidoreductase gamma subunit